MIKTSYIYFSLFILIISISIFTACNQSSEETQPAQLSQEELIKRGKYLVTVGGCDDCHSPKVMTERGPVPDTTRLLSGHPGDQPLPEIDKSLIENWALFNHSSTAAAGPWGVSFAANLTSDGTGVGSWSFEQFEKAMREGKYKGLDGSRPIMPPMPWQGYAHYTDQDLRAVFAYLKSTKPVRNVPPTFIPFAELE